MKRLFVALTLLFVSLNFVACAGKKENKTRLTQGANRGSGVSGAPTTSGWNDLNSRGYEVELQSSNPNSAAMNFLNATSGELATVRVNSVVMRLTFQNGRIVPSQTRMGLRFYDNQTEPYSYYLGTEITLKDGSRNIQVSGTKNGSNIYVEFDDGGSIIVSGYISGNTFIGSVTYDGGNTLGEFQVPISGSVYGN